MSAFRARNADHVVSIVINGQITEARAGDTVAAAVLVSGRWVFRRTALGAPRGPFCLIGVCQECLVEIDGIPNRRACMIPVRAGMKIVCG